MNGHRLLVQSRILSLEQFNTLFNLLQIQTMHIPVDQPFASQSMQGVNVGTGCFEQGSRIGHLAVAQLFKNSGLLRRTLTQFFKT